MATESSPRRQRLRCATQPAHARLDALISDAGLMQHRDRYAGYLAALWAARRPAELALEASGAAAVYAAWPDRSVCDALGQDIADVTPAAPADAPAQPRPLAATGLSAGQTLGVLYVLEGSALGARLLERRVAAIGMTAMFGARHMARQTSHPKAWSGFVDVLDNASLDPADDALCVAAALDTFEDFERAFRVLQG